MHRLEVHALVHREVSVQNVHGGRLVIVKRRKQPRCLSVVEWMHCGIYTQ